MHSKARFMFNSFIKGVVYYKFKRLRLRYMDCNKMEQWRKVPKKAGLYHV